MRLHRRSTRAYSAAQPKTPPALVLTTPAQASSKRNSLAASRAHSPGSAPPLASATAMEDAELRSRLWEGFAALQTLLGSHAKDGFVIEQPGIVASIVPSAPDSPALNAAVALDPQQAPAALQDLGGRYSAGGVRRWAIWVDGAERDVTAELRQAGLAIASASPGMGAVLDEMKLDLTT